MVEPITERVLFCELVGVSGRETEVRIMCGTR